MKKLAIKFCFLLSFVCLTTFAQENDEHKSSGGLTAGTAAPEIKGIQLNGDTSALLDFKKGYTMLVIYDPECSHCKREVPRVKILLDSLGLAKIRVYAVSLNQDKTVWKEFIDQNGLENWIHVIDRNFDSHVTKNYDVRGIPTMYFIDKKKILTSGRLKNKETVQAFVLENKIK